MKPLQSLLLASVALTLGACAGTQATKSVAAAAQPREMTAKDIVARHIDVTNTRQMVDEMSSTHVVGRIALEAMGLHGDMEIHAARPNKFSLRSSMGPAGTTLVGYNGEIGWMSNPMMGTSVLEGAELFALQMQADFEAVLMKPEQYDTIELLGREEFEGKDCYKIKMVYKAPSDPQLAEDTLKSRTSTAWFDADSGLMLGQESTQSSPQGELTVLTVFDKYEDRGGYLMSTVSIQKMMGMEVTITIDEVEANNVDASAFDIPADVQALLD